MAYCASADLLIGDTRLPSGLSTIAFVNSAADEIDAAIGYLYQTPISIDDSPINRPTMLLLKTINAWLASGRIILTISRTGEDNTLDALGRYYVNSALARINDIVEGKIQLIGATPTPSKPTFQGPTILNAEPVSPVDAFYGHFQRPARPFPLYPDVRAQ